MAALIYAQDNKGKFPRTYYDPINGKTARPTTIGGKNQGTTATNQPFSTTAPATPVGAKG